MRTQAWSLAIEFLLLIPVAAGSVHGESSWMGTGAGAQTPQTPATQGTLTALLARWRSGGPGRDQELEVGVLALGASGVPALITWVDAAPDAPESPLLARWLPNLPGDERLEALGRWSGSGPEELRLAAVKGLAGFREASAAGALLVALDDPLEAVRLAASDGIIRIERVRGDLRLAAAVGANLRKSTYPTSYCLLLGRLSDSQGHDLLIGLAGEAGPLQLPALCGLWTCAGVQDGEFLVQLLRNTVDPAIERKLCLLIGRTHCDAAARELIDRLSSKAPGLAADAHWALRQITGEYLGRSPKAWEEWWSKVGVARERAQTGSNPARR